MALEVVTHKAVDMEWEVETDIINVITTIHIITIPIIITFINTTPGASFDKGLSTLREYRTGSLLRKAGLYLVCHTIGAFSKCYHQERIG